MKKITLSLLVLVLMAGMAWAVPPVPTAGWEAFVIREASNGTSGAPLIQGTAVPGQVEMVVFSSGQKAGLGTDLINGARIDQIATLHVDRLDDINTSGSLYGPYFNIWVTDGLGEYAVLSNEPSDGEWAGSRWDVADWDFLKTKRCKVHEVENTGSLTSWVHTHALANGWNGVALDLRFEHVADLVIAPPSPAYIAASAFIGGGAPDVLGTNVAYGYNWIFGDTLANYVSGNPGFLVANYYATTVYAVQNVTQATSYSTIEAALAAANPGDLITVANGTYNPPNTLNISVPLTLTGASEAGVIIRIPAAGSYGITPTASNITLENFTLVAIAANEQYPIHASGTSNPPGGFDNLTIRNVTVNGSHRRACFDIHGYNTVVLSGLTAADSWGGNGVQLTGVVGATVDNITTTNNAWGSLSVYCSGPTYLNRASSNITIDGSSCSFGEGVVFTEDQFGLTSTNITVNGYGYLVRNNNYRATAPDFTFFQDTEANAIAHALTLDAIVPGSWITLIGGGTHVVGAGMQLQFAVAGALPGDSVEVRAGTFVAPAQIQIDRNLTITGAGSSTIIEPGYNTTSGYVSTSGLVYVAPGVTAAIEDLVIDGTGFNVNHAIQSRGTSLTVRNCEIRDISSSIYDGRGVVFLTGTGLVENCTMTNIQRIGVHVRGAVEPVAPVVAVDGLTFTGKGNGDFLDYGVEFGGGGQGTVANSAITNCLGVALSDGSTSAGILVTDYYGTGTTADVTNSTLTGNTTGMVVGYAAADISQATIHGSTIANNTTNGVTSTGVTVDALGNWWGSALGPNHPLTNPFGDGNPVSDNVLFDPWSGYAAGGIAPDATGPLNCSQTVTLTFGFTADAYTPDVFLYNAVVTATAGLDFGSVVDLKPFTDENDNFFAMSTGANEWTITGSTVGSPSHPITGPGTKNLFTITFSATGDVVGAVDFSSLTLRDPANNTLPVVLEGATITYDCTAPAAVTAINAAPGNMKVDVNWTHSGADVDHYEVFSGVWHDGSNVSAYPEYDDLANDKIPTPLATPVANAEWVKVDDAAATSLTQTWGDQLSRGVYYYTVFAVDAAGNASPAPATLDRATNYWLGDVSPAFGTVGVTDISTLGAAFGTSESNGTPPYNNLVDVGPTDDWSRLGIPTTDSRINFEDLMIFSLNFGVVTAAKEASPVSKTVDLAWVSYDNGDMGLRLVNGTGVKGLHVQADFPVTGVQAGGLLDSQSELTFLKNIGENLDVSVAVMGINQGFDGSGDLFVVSAKNPIALEDLHITVRSTENKEIAFTMDTTSGTLTPRVFALNANYPNPFNPMTKISFSLPEAQDVKLAVYSIDGRKVATLVNETRGPGLHEVVWTGRNDAGQTVASGLYFYRIDAGPYSQVHKMTLMK